MLADEENAATRMRHGYRRILVLLRRKSAAMNANRVYRLYREMGLQLRNQSPRRRIKVRLRNDQRPTVGSNDVWAMDFVYDQLATSPKASRARDRGHVLVLLSATDAQINFRGLMLLRCWRVSVAASASRRQSASIPRNSRSTSRRDLPCDDRPDFPAMSHRH